MTQGILLFAHDNEQIPYSLFAVWQANRISKWLQKPVSLVTDRASIANLLKLNIDVYKIFDKIILEETIESQYKNYNGKQLNFKNIDRCKSWELTPYDETIVMDTDIAIQSDRLNLLWNNINDMLVCRKTHDPFNRNFVGFDWLSNYGIKFYWATIFYFKKTEETKIFFNLCQHIKENYNWYAFVNDFGTKYIRNDYIWSIALNHLGNINEIPFTIAYTLDQDDIISMTDNFVTVFNNDKLIKVEGIDFHLMNKFSLLEKVKEELHYE